jgi:biotin transporter BioY
MTAQSSARASLATISGVAISCLQGARDGVITAIFLLLIAAVCIPVGVNAWIFWSGLASLHAPTKAASPAPPSTKARQ